MLNELSPWHVVIVLLVFALLFGSRRLPDAARGLARSMHIFRSEMSGNSADAPTAPPAAVAPAEPAPAIPAVAPLAVPETAPAE
jgi:sec-independent protein translocase protein TatA